MRILIIVLTLLWFYFGVTQIKNTFCGGDSSEAVESTSGVLGVTGDDCISVLVFRDKDGGLDISSAENFQFLRSSPDVMGTTSEMATVLEKLVTFLNTNPSRFMEITGLYQESEIDADSSEEISLGKDRASSVKSYLVSKGIDSKQLTTNGAMDNSICSSEEKILRGVKVAFSEIPTK